MEIQHILIECFTIATADTTLGVVCMDSCSPCSTNDCGATGIYTYGDNEDVSNAVGFTADPGDYITLDFSAGSTEQNYDYWFINDAADGSGNTLATGDGSLVGVYTSTTGEISFYVNSDGSWSPGGNGLAGSVFVYSVSCSSPPSCPDPTGLVASNVTATGVDISWTAGGTETAWNVDFGPTGFTPGTGTNITTNPYSLTGLTGNTAYDIYVQADCGSGEQVLGLDHLFLYLHQHHVLQMQFVPYILQVILIPIEVSHLHLVVQHVQVQWIL